MSLYHITQPSLRGSTVRANKWAHMHSHIRDMQVATHCTFHRCAVGSHYFLFCSALCVGVGVHMLHRGVDRHTHICMHAHTHACTHAHTHMHAHTYTHTLLLVVPCVEEDRAKTRLHSQSLALRIRHCKCWCTPNTPHHCPCMLGAKVPDQHHTYTHIHTHCHTI